MKYTKTIQKYKKELERLLTKPFSNELCEKHPSYFAHHILGIKVYNYQHLILRKFRDSKTRLNNSRIMIVKSRQIGISTCLQILSIWFAAYNKHPSGVHKNTKVGIISKDDKASKKFMADIQKMIDNAEKGFAHFIERKWRVPLSKTYLQFRNKGTIQCFPPTKAARGETFDLCIVDEAAFIEDEKMFKEVIEPTVSAVDGKIILSSTPNGQKGYFYELFDPKDILPEHEYKRYWFYWKMCENPIQKKVILEANKHARIQGNLKKFDQEYNALFTVDESAFFDDVDVERGVKKGLLQEYEYKDNPCSMGIDYGRSDSATCITIVAKENTLNLVFQFAKKNFDENLLMSEGYENSVPNLCKRFDIKSIVVDDCTQGHRTNQQLENEGYPVERFDFRSDQVKGERGRGYYLFKGMLRSCKIKYPRIPELIAEMKALQETNLKQYTSIKSPDNFTCDRIDSFMMACYPFLEDSNSFESVLVKYDELEKKAKGKINARYDPQWEKLQSEDAKWIQKRILKK